MKKKPSKKKSSKKSFMKRNIPMLGVLFVEIAVVFLAFTINTMMELKVENFMDIVNFYIDIPSVICILIVVLPILFISGMWRDFFHAFLVGRKEFSLRELKRCHEAVWMMQKLILCAAAFSFILALITILRHLDNISLIGTSISIGMLSIFYMIILEILLVPVKSNIVNAITDMMDVEDEEV